MVPEHDVPFNECEVEVDAENIQEVGASVVFPIKVRHPQAGVILRHPVTLRADFYHDLMHLEDGTDQLMRIFKSRLKEELFRRRNQNTLSISDKVHWMGTTRKLED